MVPVALKHQQELTKLAAMWARRRWRHLATKPLVTSRLNVIFELLTTHVFFNENRLQCKVQKV